MVLAGCKTQTRRLPGKSANYSVGRVYAITDHWTPTTFLREAWDPTKEEMLLNVIEAM